MFFIPVYIFILATTILIDYFAGILIEKTEGPKRKRYLVISIISTCVVLIIFKYVNFFNTNFALMAKFLHWNYPIGVLKIILPIGLSFHTFQSLSYVIEVYRGKQKAEHNFGIYSLYVMFYPQLVAGPIERPQNLIHQFYEEHYFDYSRVTNGLKLMAWGMFKKVVIADRLAVLVNQIYNAPTEYSGPYFVLATVFFAFQVYCDFSGYSDIAIGSAQVMGFKLMDNFNRPYFSKSIAEYWKRWHISLSTWFRDYLYLPLSQRVGLVIGSWRWYFNFFIVFVISGLWHGANWTYVVWGALHGFYFIFAMWIKDFRERVYKRIGIKSYPRLFKYYQIITTFSLVCFALIFFRAKNISDAFYIVGHLFTGWRELIRAVPTSGIISVLAGRETGLSLGLCSSGFILSLLLILFVELIHLIQRHGSIRHMLTDKPFLVRWSFYYCLLLGIIVFGVFNQTQFIYFQF